MRLGVREFLLDWIRGAAVLVGFAGIVCLFVMSGCQPSPAPDWVFWVTLVVLAVGGPAVLGRDLFGKKDDRP